MGGGPTPGYVAQASLAEQLKVKASEREDGFYKVIGLPSGKFKELYETFRYSNQYALVKLNENGTTVALYDIEKHASYLRSKARKKAGLAPSTLTQVVFIAPFRYDKNAAEKLVNRLGEDGRFITATSAIQDSDMEFSQLKIYPVTALNKLAESESTGVLSFPVGDMNLTAVLSRVNGSQEYAAYVQSGNLMFWNIRKAASYYKAKFQKSSSIEMFRISYLRGVETDPSATETAAQQIANLIARRLTTPGNRFVVRAESVGTDRVITIVKVK